MYISADSISLGSFEIKSHTMIVADPCYTLDCRYIARLTVRPGKWNAAMVMDGHYVSELAVFQGSGCDTDSSDWHVHPARIAVDSGQAGFFDIDSFKNDALVFDDMFHSDDRICYEKSPWYSLCCDRTLQRKGGTVPQGAVARSGMGDGVYQLRVLYGVFSDNVIAARIVFLGDDEDDWEDD